MNRRGQLILLSGLLVAMAVALVSLYLTTASISGYRVSYSPWDLPYYEMRMAVFESVRAIKYYKTITPYAGRYVEGFYRNMSKIFARHGYFLLVNANMSTYPYVLNLTFRTDKVYFKVRKYVAVYK